MQELSSSTRPPRTINKRPQVCCDLRIANLHLSLSRQQSQHRSPSKSAFYHNSRHRPRQQQTHSFFRTRASLLTRSTSIRHRAVKQRRCRCCQQQWPDHLRITFAVHRRPTSASSGDQSRSRRDRAWMEAERRQPVQQRQSTQHLARAYTLLSRRKSMSLPSPPVTKQRLDPAQQQYRRSHCSIYRDNDSCGASDRDGSCSKKAQLGDPGACRCPRTCGRASG